MLSTYSETSSCNIKEPRIPALSWLIYDQNKKNEIHYFYPRQDGMSKKTSHATVPLKLVTIINNEQNDADPNIVHYR